MLKHIKFNYMDVLSDVLTISKWYIVMKKLRP